MILTDLCIVAAVAFVLPLTNGKRTGQEAAEHGFAAIYCLILALVMSL